MENLKSPMWRPVLVWSGLMVTSPGSYFIETIGLPELFEPGSSLSTAHICAIHYNKIQKYFATTIFTLTEPDIMKDFLKYLTTPRFTLYNAVT
jgi:hypothetical protein